MSRVLSFEPFLTHRLESSSLTLSSNIYPEKGSENPLWSLPTTIKEYLFCEGVQPQKYLFKIRIFSAYIPVKSWEQEYKFSYVEKIHLTWNTLIFSRNLSTHIALNLDFAHFFALKVS